MSAALQLQGFAICSLLPYHAYASTPTFFPAYALACAGSMHDLSIGSRLSMPILRSSRRPARLHPACKDERGSTGEAQGAQRDLQRSATESTSTNEGGSSSRSDGLLSNRGGARVGAGVVAAGAAAWRHQTEARRCVVCALSGCCGRCGPRLMLSAVLEMRAAKHSPAGWTRRAARPRSTATSRSRRRALGCAAASDAEAQCSLHLPLSEACMRSTLISRSVCESELEAGLQIFSLEPRCAAFQEAQSPRFLAIIQHTCLRRQHHPSAGAQATTTHPALLSCSICRNLCTRL